MNASFRFWNTPCKMLHRSVGSYQRKYDVSIGFSAVSLTLTCLTYKMRRIFRCQNTRWMFSTHPQIKWEKQQLLGLFCILCGGLSCTRPRNIISQMFVDVQYTFHHIIVLSFILFIVHYHTIWKLSREDGQRLVYFVH